MIQSTLSTLLIVFNGLVAMFTAVLAYATWKLVTVNERLLRATRDAAESATQSAEAATAHAEIAHKDYEHSRRPVVYIAWDVGLRIVTPPPKAVISQRLDILWIRGRLVDAARVPTTLHSAHIKLSTLDTSGDGDGWEKCPNVKDTLLYGEHLYFDAYAELHINADSLPDINDIIAEAMLCYEFSAEGGQTETWIAQGYVVYGGQAFEGQGEHRFGVRNVPPRPARDDDEINEYYNPK